MIEPAKFNNVGSFLRAILETEGKDAETIKLGSPLSHDPLADKRFDFQFVNPPYGYE